MRNATRYGSVVVLAGLASCGPTGAVGDPQQTLPGSGYELVERDWGWPGLELELRGYWGSPSKTVAFVFPGVDQPVAADSRVGTKVKVTIPKRAERGPVTIAIEVDGVEVGQVTAEILDAPIVECSQPPGRICCDAETPDCRRCHAIAREERVWWKARCGGVEW